MRFWFGLSVASKIMTVVVRRILESNQRVRAVTSHYIDDVMVYNDIVEIERVIAAFQKYGSELRPVTIDGSRVLELQVRSDGSQLNWSRAAGIPKPLLKQNKRDLLRDLLSIYEIS
ncbi:hypothetical protein GJ496_006626 [Pomphorhynchus laevis]|nr:hypothetical protein GJ496_006626 [Pomphorhynchus laevis]